MSKCTKCDSSLHINRSLLHNVTSGFYQIPMHADSVEKTAFVTPDGQYEFLRMPFGLANAPSVFQRAMNKTLGELRFKTALVYMDDILIPSENLEEGFESLALVLEALRRNGFTLNLEKCKFFQRQLEYLGREVSKEGVKPGALKTTAVVNAPTPRNVKEVRQFLGLSGYFRRFIKDYAKKVAPLTDLLRKDVPWVWKTRQSDAVKSIKDALSERPILAIYDPTRPTEVHTDASSIGLGAILLQETDGLKRAVAYYSRKTSVEERNYHSYELETLAVVAALKAFRVYLLGIKFTVVTDCSAVRATAAKKGYRSAYCSMVDVFARLRFRHSLQT